MENRQLVGKLITVTRLHRKNVDALVAGLGIYPSQHHLLMHLDCHGRMVQNELAAALGISAAATAVSLKKLEKGGYVERQMDEKDNRANLVALTEAGQCAVRRSRQLFDEYDERMFTGFSEQEKELFAGYLERMLVNMQERVPAALPVGAQAGQTGSPPPVKEKNAQTDGKRRRPAEETGSILAARSEKIPADGTGSMSVAGNGNILADRQESSLSGRSETLEKGGNGN